jgi:hypothetical protein
MRDRRRRGASRLGWLVILAAIAAGSPVRAQSKCAKFQLLATGQAARRYTACAANAAETGAPLDQACLDTVADKLRRKWERAVARGDCPTAAAADDAQAVLETFLAAAVGLTLPGAAAHCCDAGSACYVAPSIDASSCQFELSGTLGPPGSVCDGAADCATTPASAGPCCQLSYVCVTGSNFDAGTCAAAGGSYHAAAVCDASGACVPL